MHLVPRALAVLAENPLIDGDRYRDDLIRSILAVDPAYWEEHQDDWIAMHEIIDGILEAVGELSEPIERWLDAAVADFSGVVPEHWRRRASAHGLGEP
jgi:hypothetical protein